MKFLRFQVCPNKLANAINFLFQTTSVAYAHKVNIFCFKSFVYVLFYYDYSGLALDAFLRKSSKATCLLLRVAARLSSFHGKTKRLAFKAILRCMGGDLSAVVQISSHCPRMFFLLTCRPVIAYP